MGKNKNVSYRTISIKNSNGDDLEVYEQNHYNDRLYTVEKVNGEENNDGGNFEHLSSAIKSTEK
jgi:hypothetical protein